MVTALMTMRMTAMETKPLGALPYVKYRLCMEGEGGGERVREMDTLNDVYVGLCVGRGEV